MLGILLVGGCYIAPIIVNNKLFRRIVTMQENMNEEDVLEKIEENWEIVVKFSEKM